MSDRCPACGLVHAVSIDEIVVGRDARERLGRFVAANRWSRLVLVADANTNEVLGEALGADLGAAGHRVASVVFPERHGLLADEHAVGAVRDEIARHHPAAVVAIGSGVINDVSRYASLLEGLPYVVAPTAPSMDGYASSVAAMQFEGVKVTLPAHAPVGIFADVHVLSRAPREMLRWGFGDLIGKASARFDWTLGAGISDEVFCTAVEARVLKPLIRCVEDVGRLLDGDEDAVVALTSGLIESGVAMAMMGNSRPASGCEHHASHFWDLLAFRNVREHEPHGLQVGYATRFALEFQRFALRRLGDPLLVSPGSGGGVDEREWFGDQFVALGPVRDEKQTWFATHGDRWPPNDAAVQALRDRLEVVASSFGDVHKSLDVAGIPRHPGFFGVDRPTMRATFRYANRLRSRFTALDLLESQRLLESAIDELVP